MNKYDIALDFASADAGKPKEYYLDKAESYIKSHQTIILFTTDIHAQNQKLGIIEQKKDELIGEGNNVLLVDSGDINEASKDITLSMNNYYDCVTAGNHDGLCNGQNFFKRVNEATFTYVSYDIVRNNEPVLPPYKIFEFDSMKIGFIGQSRINHGSGKWDGAKSVRDPVKFQQYVDELRPQVDYVIALIHDGEEECKKILKKVSGIDIILAGHYHQKKNKILKDKDGKDVYFAMAGHRLNCYGILTISDKIRIELIDL